MIRDRYSVIFGAIITAASLCVCVNVVPAISTSCQKLHRAYEKNGPERTISVYGHERSLSVYWNGSAPSRAAAALLLVALRHGLRYKLLQLTNTPSSLCALQAEREKLMDEDNWPNYTLMTAPSITWNESAASECETGIASGRLQVLSTGAAPISLKPKAWDPHPNSDAIQTVRVADVSMLRQFAPSILEVFSQFWPASNVIREVLEMETNHNVDITEAACAWALNNSAEFDRWIKLRIIRIYEVVVFLCRDDPESVLYGKVLDLFETLKSESLNPQYRDQEVKLSLNTTIRILNVDCADEYSLMKKFMERAQSVYFPRLIGVVASGAGTRAAANVASALYTPLVLFDIPGSSSDGPLQRGARSATGKLEDLITAFKFFFKSSRWSRISIISEKTKLASDFVTALQADKHITVLNVPLETSANTALSVLLEKNARIIFINGDSDVAKSILCAAYELGKLGDISYVWILREWRSEYLICGNLTVHGDDIFYFSISFWWRGGDQSLLTLKPTQHQHILYKKLETMWGTDVWPQKIAPLVDAITMLLRRFYNLMEYQPECLDDLHIERNYRAFWESYDSKPPTGTTQQLTLSDQTQSQPNIYFYKWHDKKHELKAIWQIYNDTVKVLHQPGSIFDKSTPSDGRKSCLTTTSGDKFAPHCHDQAWFTVMVAIIMAVPAALLARRARHKHIARRDRELTARLLARGRRASAALAAHLVDRATLQLGRMLGEGRFGRVHLAILRPPGKQPLVVAAKTLREEATQAEEREFLNEAVTLASLSHNYVVKLIGVCATGGPPLLLMEHAFFGDLLEYLHERRHLVGGEGEVRAEAEQVSAPALTRLAHQAATALDYLRQQRLVHRDVRASNCLVDARRSLKLADFGLARKMETGATGGDEEYLCRRHGPLPVLWMAPESLARGVFTAATDAWALGVLLLELATLGARPYGCWALERVIRYVCTGGYPPLPMDVTPDLRRLLLQCWRRVPAERASAAEIARELTRSPTALRPALESPEPNEYCLNRNLN